MPTRLALLLLLVLSGALAAADHASEVEAWRAARDADLRRPDGWLSLVGLHWLEPGASSFGSSEGCVLRFPAKAPARVGVYHLGEDGSVTLEVETGVEVRDREGRPVTRLGLDPRAEPVVLTSGSLSWHLVERDGRVAVRVRDSESEVLRTFAGMEYYPVDPAWRLEGRFEPYAPPRSLPVATILGTVTRQPCPGALVLPIGGREVRLDVMGQLGDEEYFLVFGDATNGDGTYEGGRFLYVAAPGPDGRVVVDFNRAYNPPCVFTPYATCPLPPRQNRLDVRVEAGERRYARH